MFTFPVGFLAEVSAGGVSGAWGDWDATTDGSIVTYETAVTDVADSNNWSMAVCEIDTNKYLVAYNDVTNSNVEAVVLTLSGETITVNTPVLVYGIGHSVAGIDICKLDTDKALIQFFHSDLGDELICKVLSVSGTAISVGGSEVSPTPSCTRHRLVQLDTDKALSIFRDSNNSDYGTANVITVSGTTPTKNTNYVFESAHALQFGVAKISATQVLVCYRDAGNSNYGTAQILDISGTAVTANTPTVYESAAAHNNTVDILDTGVALVCYTDVGNSSYLTAEVLTYSGSAVTANTAQEAHQTSVAGKKVVALSTTQAIVVYDDNTAVDGKGLVMQVDGTTITFGTPATVESTEMTDPYAVLIDANSVLLIYADEGDSLKGKAKVVSNA